MRFVTPLILSFVYIPQLGDDLWPHSQEGSEKPIAKDFQLSHLTKSDWLFWNAGINRWQCKIKFCGKNLQPYPPERRVADSLRVFLS